MTQKSTQMDMAISIACNLDVFTPAEREQHLQDAQQVMSRRLESVELPDGYAFRYAADGDIVRLLGAFIDDERKCCPFFHFALEIEPGSETVWLKLTGSDDVKAFIAAEMGS